MKLIFKNRPMMRPNLISNTKLKLPFTGLQSEQHLMSRFSHSHQLPEKHSNQLLQYRDYICTLHIPHNAFPYRVSAPHTSAVYDHDPLAQLCISNMKHVEFPQCRPEYDCTIRRAYISPENCASFTSSWAALLEQLRMPQFLDGYSLWPLPCLQHLKTLPDVRKFILTTASKFRAASFIMAARARLTKTGPMFKSVSGT